jgi:hypothetical protein
MLSPEQSAFLWRIPMPIHDYQRVATRPQNYVECI